MELKSIPRALGATMAAAALAASVDWSTDRLPPTPKRKYRRYVERPATGRAYKGSALAKRRTRRGGSHAA